LIELNAAVNSDASFISIKCTLALNSLPSDKGFKNTMFPGLVELINTAKAVASGSACRSNSIVFFASSALPAAVPVIIPPGRAKLLAHPVATGSPLATDTIATEGAALWIAKTEVVPLVTMTFTLSDTNSLARVVAQSWWESEEALSPA